jgi:hypothetical protein
MTACMNESNASLQIAEGADQGHVETQGNGALEGNTLHCRMLDTANRMRTRRASGQRGGILDEFGFYLIIAGLMLVAVLVLSGSNSSDTATQQLTVELNTVIGKTTTSYRGQFNKVSISALVANGMFKNMTAMTASTGSSSNVTLQPGGGALTVAAATLLVANDALDWTISNQPDSACTTIVSAYQSSASKILVNGTTVKAVGGTVDPSKVSCSGNANTIDLFTA